MKVRYWREETDTEFYEEWPETGYNRFVELKVPKKLRPLLKDKYDEG